MSVECGVAGRAGQCALSPRDEAMRAIALNVPPHIFPRQARWKPAPRFCAAGANGTNMRQCWSARRKATAIDSKSSKVRREDSLATAQIKPETFTLSRCTSAELFFSCCDSVVALALANCKSF